VILAASLSYNESGESYEKYLDFDDDFAFEVDATI
jgi:hypothetical protein